MKKAQYTIRVCLMLGIGSTGLWNSASVTYAKGQIPRRYDISDVAENVTPTVVNITTRRKTTDFSSLPHPPDTIPIGAGSGVLISSEGDIVTNNHVVDGASEIVVTLSDNRAFSAQVIGRDKSSDLAFIKIPAQNLPFLKLGDSSKLRLGEFVVAVGHPFGVGQTVTLGIVSAQERTNIGILDYENFIQTDAAINPGNSGGALVNLDGDLVGINTAILARSGGAQGIGFAVPSNTVLAIKRQIEEHGQVKRGWLGLIARDLTSATATILNLKNTNGVEIEQIYPDSPADKSGLREHDVIVSIDGKKISSFAQLRTQVAFIRPGTRIKLSLMRSGQSVDVPVVLEERQNFLPFPEQKN